MPAALADTLQPVELADGVAIHLRVAGPAVRSMAWMIDWLIFVALLIGLAIIVGLSAAFIGDHASTGVYMLAVFALNWFYNVFFEMGKKAATPGQRRMGLKVASVSGGPVRLPQSMIRNLLRVVDFMPFAYLFGLVCCLFTHKFQRLGDLVADTVVVYADPKQKPATEVPVNVEPQAPPVALSRVEQAALLQFLERAPNWSDARKIELTDVLQPLTHETGSTGLTRVCRIGVWLRHSGGRS
jgi:uncharacterized RDD family membrane protein YckC